MQNIAPAILSDLDRIKKHKPIVLNLTNYVAMDLSANALLAVGASPIMAHAPEEIEELVKLSNAVVLNIGTLDSVWMKSIELAAQYANQYNKPLILDPVGAGASELRTQFCLKLLRDFKMTNIRGNASEILSLGDHKITSHGIDSYHSSHESAQLAHKLSTRLNCCITISGATDYVVDSKTVWILENGNPMMSQVTAMGCTATSIIGAFLSINSNWVEATRNAMIVMGVSGEEAAKKALGPGSLRMNFLDTLYNFSELSLANLKAYQK